MGDPAATLQLPPRADEAGAATRPERRLAAILIMDVAGYSRLMEADERGTHERLTRHREQLAEPLVAEHGGRVVKLMGDGTLCEFASAVDAVECAAHIQQGMVGREVNVAEGERIRFRIGINLGDVIREPGGDLYGDGVNIAARLEQLAEPGGICVSRTVYDHAHGKVAVGFRALGLQRVKNISQAVETYSLDLAGVPARRRRRIPRRSVLMAVAAGLLLALAAGGWWLQGRWGDRGFVPLPGRPSIAVLAFDNLSGDASQDYFSDGIAEEILTALGRSAYLSVIARNSSFAFKGKATDVKEIGHELGVLYVLEGSVKRDGERVRVTAHLADARTGDQIWAEHYDRPLGDIFALQDEIAATTAARLGATIERTEAEMARRKAPGDLGAYDYYLQGRAKR